MLGDRPPVPLRHLADQRRHVLAGPPGPYPGSSRLRFICPHKTHDRQPAALTSHESPHPARSTAIGGCPIYSRGFPVRGRATARRDALCAGRCYIASPPSRPRLVTRFRLWRGAGRCSGASGRWPGAAVAGRTSAARRRGGRGRSARRRTAGRDRRAGRSRRSTA